MLKVKGFKMNTLSEFDDENLDAAIIHDNDDTTRLIVERTKLDSDYLYYLFHLAIVFGSMRCIKYFVEKQGLDVNYKDTLALAKSKYNTEVIDYLISKGSSDAH